MGPRLHDLLMQGHHNISLSHLSNPFRVFCPNRFLILPKICTPAHSSITAGVFNLQVSGGPCGDALASIDTNSG